MGVHTPRTEGGKDVVSAILEDDRIGPQSLADWLASDPPESDEGGLSRDDLKDWMEEYGDHRDLDEAFEPVQQPPRFPPASPDLHLDHEDLNEVRAPGLGKAPSPNHDALLSVQSDPLNEGIVPSSSRVPMDDLGHSIDQEPHPPTFQVAENSDPSAPTGLRDVVETVRLPAGMDQSSHDNSDVAVVEVDESSSIALSPSPSLDGSSWGLDPGMEPPTLHVPSPTIVGNDVSTSKPLSEELRSDL
eukprot:jgi/Pico_ML_1/51212/g2286.t1